MFQERNLVSRMTIALTAASSVLAGCAAGSSDGEVSAAPPGGETLPIGQQGSDADIALSVLPSHGVGRLGSVYSLAFKNGTQIAMADGSVVALETTSKRQDVRTLAVMLEFFGDNLGFEVEMNYAAEKEDPAYLPYDSISIVVRPPELNFFKDSDEFRVEFRGKSWEDVGREAVTGFVGIVYSNRLKNGECLTEPIRLDKFFGEVESARQARDLKKLAVLTEGFEYFVDDKKKLRLTAEPKKGIVETKYGHMAASCLLEQHMAVESALPLDTVTDFGLMRRVFSSLADLDKFKTKSGLEVTQAGSGN